MIWLLILLLMPIAAFNADSQRLKNLDTRLSKLETEFKEQAKSAEEIQKKATQASQRNQYLLTGYSGQQIKIQCSDVEEPLEVPLELAQNYSVTLKNFIEDLGGDHPIPVLSTANTLKCLVAFAKKLYDAEPRNMLSDARKTFQEIMWENISGNKKENFALDLLLQANYLDFKTDVYDKKYELYFPFKSLVASLYADSLSAKPPQILPAHGGLLLFDELHSDLYRLVVGWLLHDLLLKQKPITREKSFTFGDLHINPILSSSGSHSSFACVYQQIGGEEKFQSDLLDSRYLLLDLKKDPIQSGSIDSLDKDIWCTLSQGNKYLIVDHRRNDTTFCELYDISSNKKEKYKRQFLLLKSGQDSNPTLAVLFDEVHNKFKIVTTQFNRDTKLPKQYFYSEQETSYCYSIDPILTQVLNQKNINNTKPFMNSTSVRKKIIEETVNKQLFINTNSWSCINGKIIGINQYQKNKNFIDEALILDKTLALLPLDPKKIYSDGTAFDIVTTTIQGSDGKESPLRIAIPPSCIPAFGNIISKKLQNTIKALSSYQTKPAPERILTQFDPNHLHMNFIVSDSASETSKIGIYYPCDPNLLAAINAINKEAFINPNNPQLIFTAYFLKEFYDHPDTWKERCKAFTPANKQYILPEVEQLYGLVSYVPKITPNYPYQQEYEKTAKQRYTPKKHIPKKTSPTSFLSALKQGKFWEYTKQQWQPLLGGAAFVAGTSALGAWLWSKYGRSLPHQPKILGARPRTP